MREASRGMKSSIAGLTALLLATGAGVAGAQAFELPKFGLPSFTGSSDGPLTPGLTTDCPLIVVDDGAHMMRTPENADAASVHHQVSIRDTARECIISGEQLNIRVGIQGDAVLGPTGSPGTYGGSIRVALRRIKDDSIVASKNYRVSATVPAGATRADFHLLADPITIAATPKPQEEYDILIGFTNGTAEVADKGDAGTKRKKRRR
jgi:hypothetical protein